MSNDNQISNDYPIRIEVFEYPFGLDLGGWFKDVGEHYEHRTGFRWRKSDEGLHYKVVELKIED